MSVLNLMTKGSFLSKEPTKYLPEAPKKGEYEHTPTLSDLSQKETVSNNGKKARRVEKIKQNDAIGPYKNYNAYRAQERFFRYCAAQAYNEIDTPFDRIRYYAFVSDYALIIEHRLGRTKSRELWPQKSQPGREQKIDHLKYIKERRNDFEREAIEQVSNALTACDKRLTALRDIGSSKMYEDQLDEAGILLNDIEMLTQKYARIFEGETGLQMQLTNYSEKWGLAECIYNEKKQLKRKLAPCAKNDCAAG